MDGVLHPRRRMPKTNSKTPSKTIRSPRHHALLDLLVAVRKEAKLTQVALAERLGRPQSFVAKVETGERRLDVVEFVALVEALGGEPGDVFARFLDAGRR